MAKTTYSRAELHTIGDDIKRQNIQPTEEQQRIYDIIEEIPTAAASAPSARSAKTSMASRFSNDKKWDAGIKSRSVESGTSHAPSSAPSQRRDGQRDRGGRGSGDHSSGERSWRHGEKDRETFEEGFLYELRQSERHKQNLSTAVSDWESKKKETIAAPAPVIASKEYTSVDEVEAMLTNLAGKRVASQEDDAPDSPPTFSVAKKSSRFFAEEPQQQPTAKEPVGSSSGSPPPTNLHLDIPMPSPNVVWNQVKQQPAPVSQGGVKKQQAAQIVPPVPAPSPKVTVGNQKAKSNPNPRVWSASDLENHLLGQQGSAPLPAATGQGRVTSGTFDAASLEQELLNHGHHKSGSLQVTAPPVSNAQQPQRQPKSSPSAPPSTGAWPGQVPMVMNLPPQANSMSSPPTAAPSVKQSGVSGFHQPMMVLPGGPMPPGPGQQHPMFSGGNPPPMIFYPQHQNHSGAAMPNVAFPQVMFQNQQQHNAQVPRQAPNAAMGSRPHPQQTFLRQ